MNDPVTSMSSRHRWRYGLGFAAVVLVGLVLALASQSLLFVDTNDFQRVVGHLGLTPLGDGIRWAMPERPFRMAGNPELTSHIFSLAALVQRAVPGGVFDLARTALAAKCLMLVYACVLGYQCSRALQRGPLACTVIALGWLVVFFMAHNIAMAQTFYAEYGFLMALPLLVVGVLAQRPRVRMLCLGVGAFVCGLAKVQYFYLPLLVLVCVWVADRWQGQAPAKALIRLLVVVQVLCMVPALIGKNAAFNAYHGVYLGSYMVLTPGEMDGLGVPAQKRQCAGLDAWNNQLSGPGGTVVKDVGHTCFPEVPRLGKGDVLRPYLHYPQAFIRLALFALPHHFTVHYFHVYPGANYLQRLQATPALAPATDLLVALTDLRERTVTPMAPVVVVAALVLFALSRRCSARGLQCMATAGLVLALLVVSQIAITLLGEGIRDLSKHLWGAQMALDMLTLLVVLQCLGWVQYAARSQRAPTAPAVGAAPLKPQG